MEEGGRGGGDVSLPDRIIHFTGIFGLCFPVWKINTRSSPAGGDDRMMELRVT